MVPAVLALVAVAVLLPIPLAQPLAPAVGPLAQHGEPAVGPLVQRREPAGLPLAQRMGTSGSRQPDGPAGWPLPGGAPIVRRFDPPSHAWLAGHRGIDLVAPAGRPVAAPISGTVTVARHIVDRGVVVIADGDVFVSLEPVEPSVTVGEAVLVGDVVGAVGEGRTHCQPRCLHWGLRSAGNYHDPLLLVVPHEAVLLP